MVVKAARTKNSLAGHSSGTSSRSSRVPAAEEAELSGLAEELQLEGAHVKDRL